MKVASRTAIVASLLFRLHLALAAGQEADHLGGDLTPLGGEKAASQDGAVPEWTGTEQPLPGWVWGKERFDFWKHKEEKPLYSIDASNVDKYAQKLTPGQIQVIKQTKGYRMDVYPSHRTCDVPAFVAENTKKNVTAASLAQEGWYLKDAYMPGIPFPFPKNGVEAMLNGKFHYRGVGIEYNPIITSVSPHKGSSEWIKAGNVFTWYLPWGKNGSALLSKTTEVESYMYTAYTSPAALAGQALVITMWNDKPGNETYYYFPGQRRVRRMPTFAYDSPQIGYENQYTMDEPAVLIGTLDRFDWKLVGKKELIVPYNSFGASHFSGKFEDYAQENFVNPAARRYETHRVWVVEATVKPQMRHLAPKRTYYLDEDSWTYLAAEDYDGEGNIWKYREAYVIPVYEIGACDFAGTAQYNLVDGRYLVDFYAAASGRDIKWLIEANGPRFSPAFYTAENLRAISER